MPFTGNEIVLIDFRRSLAERAAARKVVGPYRFPVGEPIRSGRDVPKGFGFYMGKRGEMDRHGSHVRLRVESADAGLSRHSRLWGVSYYTDADQIDTLTPIIARLPRSRGFLAGWSMGEDMAAVLERYIYADAEDAARAAHSLAEQTAEEEMYRDACEEDAED